MFHSFVATLYPRVPASFRSDYPVDEAVKRLREVVAPTIFHSLFKQSAVGKVRKDCVRIQRVIPFFGNSFKPIFVGAFKDTANGPVLEGAFTTFMFSKVFMTLWFGFAFIWTAIAIVAFVFVGLTTVAGHTASDTSVSAVVMAGNMILLPVSGMLLIFFGCGLLRFCWWLSRGDIEFLSKTIARALTRE
jgi:hypothetical protein